MIVISDTTPLISLMKIGHLDLLEKYFQEVQIPEAVFRELTSNPRFADEIRECIGILRDSGRHIGEKFLQMLYEQIQD